MARTPWVTRCWAVMAKSSFRDFATSLAGDLSENRRALLWERQAQGWDPGKEYETSLISKMEDRVGGAALFVIMKERLFSLSGEMKS